MLEEKLDLLTKEIVALRKAVEANSAAGGATAPAEEKAAKPKRGRPAKEEAPEPDHDQGEVEAIIRKVSKDIGRPAAVKIIKSFKCDDLADLLTHPEHFDAAYEAAEAALGEDDGPADPEDDI